MKLLIVGFLLFVGYRLVFPKPETSLPEQFDEMLSDVDDTEFIEHEELD